MFWKKEDTHEFKPEIIEIEEKAVSPIGRFILWIIILSFFFLVGWLFFAKIDVVVSAKGVVVPEEEIKVVQPLDSGVVSKILVKPGDFVEEGQPLIELDPAITEPELSLIEKKIEQIKIINERLSALIYEKPFYVKRESNQFYLLQKMLYGKTLNAYRSKINSLLSKRKEIQKNIERIDIEIKTNTDLLNTLIKEKEKLYIVKDIIPQKEIEDLKKEIIKIKGRINSLKKEKNSLELQIVQIENELKNYKQSFKESLIKELTQNEKQLTELENRLKQIKFKYKKQVLKSPIDGWIKQLSVFTVGAVVTPAEKLIYIVPANNKLFVKALVENKDVGYIKEGMDVKVKLDTYNFQKYGVLQGKVRLVSKDSIEDEKLGRVYEVYIDLLKSCLSENKCAKPGMTVLAEINIGKRRVIEFFIYPIIRYMDEGLSVR
ncbi:HlyD family type I secretion periplasmic adaptor subunit [Persephonella sp.]